MSRHHYTTRVTQSHLSHAFIGGMWLILTIMVYGYGTIRVFAQTSPSVLYVPLIGISSVPDPLALPNGPADVTYRYAVKNFLSEVPLTGVKVADDVCPAVAFVEGDDDGDANLDYGETWRYICTTNLSKTTQSKATVTGYANSIAAVHSSYATVVVGSSSPAPLVNIINVTKVAYPLNLPASGGDITFIYRVSNPGAVPLSDVVVTDDKCSRMSGKLGDTNGNSLLDVSEVWTYTCATNLKQTTTNTVSVVAFANHFKAFGSATITVKVDTLRVETTPGFPDQSIPSLPDTGAIREQKILVWEVLVGVLLALTALLWFAGRGIRFRVKEKDPHI